MHFKVHVLRISLIRITVHVFLVRKFWVQYTWHKCVEYGNKLIWVTATTDKFRKIYYKPSLLLIVAGNLKGSHLLFCGLKIKAMWIGLWQPYDLNWGERPPRRHEPNSFSGKIVISCEIGNGMHVTSKFKRKFVMLIKYFAIKCDSANLTCQCPNRDVPFQK